VQLHPTRATFHVAVASIGLVTLGATARLAPVAAFGGAMLIAIGFARAVAQIGVMRLRKAGFVMGWSSAHRVHRVHAGGTLVIRGELYNRGLSTLRGTALRPIASSLLSVTIEPSRVELSPGSSVGVDFVVKADRVGYWGIHGMGLLLAVTPFGAEAVFEIPLQFAIPLGIEVFPATLAELAARPRGGRVRRDSRADVVGRARGEGDALRELRQYASGDPFKRIAWKPSARRGHLLVREMDRGEPSIVWLVVDASVELWAGPRGLAPLDRVIDEVAALAAGYLRRGDLVGLAVVASRVHAWIKPARGPAQGWLIAAALARSAAALDADRSGLDESEVARRVAEHAAPFERAASADWYRRNFDSLAARADRLRLQAPFSVEAPLAPTARQRRLRHYLAAFGIESPPHVEGERARAEQTLDGAIERLAIERRRPNEVHVWAPPPSRPEPLRKRIARLRARGIEVCWSLPPFELGVGHGLAPESSAARAADIVNDAVRIRARAARERGERALRRIGVRVAAPVVSRRQASAAQRPVDGGEQQRRRTSG
jgi:uncharacterized protein (DUF58 family)